MGRVFSYREGSTGPEKRNAAPFTSISIKAPCLGQRQGKERFLPPDAMHGSFCGRISTLAISWDILEWIGCFDTGGIGNTPFFLSRLI